MTPFQQSAFPDSIEESSFLVQTVRNETGQAETQLAIIALGKSKNRAALPCLLDVLWQHPTDYWYHAYADEALARIGSKDAVPILRECLQSPEYHALPDGRFQSSSRSLGMSNETCIKIQPDQWSQQPLCDSV